MTESFNPVIAHIQAGGRAGLCWLIHAEFGDGDMRAWPGVGDLVTGGETWTGTNGTVEIPGLQLELGFIASKLDITLSGVNPAFQTRAENNKTLVQSRTITIFLQGLSQDDWQPLGDPVAVWTGLMDIMKYSGTVDRASITLSCETPFVTRNKPRGAYYTDADQKRRYPGDEGCEFVSALEDKNVDQPVVGG